MAMVSGSTDDESDAPSRRAGAVDGPMQAVARAAGHDNVQEYERDDEVEAAAVWATTNFREALDRLGRA